MAIVIMLDPMVIDVPDTRNGRLDRIVFKDRNPDHGSADIRLGILVKHILMHRPRTLVASQGTGGREQRQEPNYVALRIKTIFKGIEGVIQDNHTL